MTVYTFTVPGKAVPWMRTNTNQSQRFTPAAQRVFQESVRTYAKLAGVKLLSGALRIDVVTYLTGRVAPHKRGSGDWDNYAKSVADALERVAYENDCQIVDGHSAKLAPDAAGPRVEVRIEALDTPQPLKRARSKPKPKLGATPSLFNPGEQP